MAKIHVYLPDELVEWMNQRKEQQGCSRSWLIRQAIKDYRNKTERIERPPAAEKPPRQSQ